MSYRIRIPKREDNEMEKVPLAEALCMERHLQTVAQREGMPSRCRALFTFEAGEYALHYRIDDESQTITVVELTRRQQRIESIHARP